MDAERRAMPAAAAPPTRDPDPTAAEDEEETPLLFMDQLPSSFQQSAQLAALATFMADSDDDAAVDDRDEASEAGNGSKQRCQRDHKSTRARRRQLPYAKPAPKDEEPKNRENTDRTKSTDTKELQLFLSMFHVS